MYTIYVIKNKENSKVYTGYSMCINRRFRQHRSDLEKGKHHCKHLQNAYNKYGEDAFEYLVVELDAYQNKQEAADREILLISGYKTQGLSYNATRGGIGGCGPRSNETKEKIRKGLIGNKNSLGVKRTTEQKLALLKANEGKKHSEETKEKMRQAKLGRKQSLEHIEKRIKARKGKSGSLKNRPWSEARRKAEEDRKKPRY